MTSEKPTCNVCGKQATVKDTEYDEYYCSEHADHYKVLDGPHVWLDEKA